MSRIGKLPITLPAGVEVTVSKDNLVTVKGKLGTLYQEVKPAVIVEVQDNVCVVKVTDATNKQNNALHGLYRALIQNMVIGVTEGYKTVLELVGVGYKASNKGQLLELGLGFSHNVLIELPTEGILFVGEEIRRKDGKTAAS